MLNNIEIQNYRNLKHLRIEKLGRVNLIIGRNNTGKTSLLEGLQILLLLGSNNIFNSILHARQEKNPNSNQIKSRVEELTNLFYGRERGFEENKIEITSDTSTNYSKKFSLRFIRYIEEQIVIDNTEPRKIFNEKKEVSSNSGESKIGIEVCKNDEKTILSFDENDLYNTINADIFFNSRVADICNFVAAGCETSDKNTERWWSKTALTEKEVFVTEALNMIEPRIERISQIKDETFTSRFLIRLGDQKKPIPLRSMGDGINRIFTIILAMVNCENGYLLIDEFENGLHYSVQEKLWEIIFHLAERLNIQVFVTTHSSDTIRAFENIVNQNEMIPLDGLLIKLENINDTIKATTFEPSELKIITDNLIEVRR